MGDCLRRAPRERLNAAMTSGGALEAGLSGNATT